MNTNKHLITFLLVLVSVYIFNSCRKDDPEWNLETIPPKIRTLDVLDVGVVSATIRAKIIHNGGTKLIEKGICYNTTPNPTIFNSTKLSNTENTEAFSVKINNLSEGKKYYVRSFARNKEGLVYGEELQFETKFVGNVITVSSSSITSNSAVLRGNLISVGSNTIKRRGFKVSENVIPEQNGLTFNHSSNILGEYEVAAMGLKTNTKYYYRAYVETDLGFSYGDVKDFTTIIESKPTVITGNAMKISSISFSCEGNVTSEGSSSVTRRGICYSTSQNPTTNSNVKDAASGGIGPFSCIIDFFQPNGVTYYIRAFAINSVGVAYGEQVIYVASACLPTLSTTNVSSVTSNSAISGGSISSNGGSNITSRGVVWSTFQNPTINLSTKTNEGAGSGSFASSLSGLSPNTTYYVRAYATNSCGTSYGSQLSFQTSNSNFVGTITIGNGTSVGSSQSDPVTTPFGTRYTDNKHIFLIRASEILSQGGNSGYIADIGFEVVGRANALLQNFTIKIGTTNYNEFNMSTTNFNYNVTTDIDPFNLSNYSSGWIKLPLNPPFLWDGVKNIVIETCFNNSVYHSQNSTVRYSKTNFYSTLFNFVIASNVSGCTIPLEYYYDERPNIRLYFE